MKPTEDNELGDMFGTQFDTSGQLRSKYTKVKGVIDWVKFAQAGHG